MGEEKGVPYYCCIFCAENRHILQLLLISIDSLQKCSNDAYKLYKPPCTYIRQWGLGAQLLDAVAHFYKKNKK